MGCLAVCDVCELNLENDWPSNEVGMGVSADAGTDMDLKLWLTDSSCGRFGPKQAC